MANCIRVNTSRLGSDAERVQSCIRDMKSEMSKMKTSVKQLDSMWDGSSSEAFKKAFNDDVAALGVIIKNLESVHNFEVNAKKKYESCEAKVNELVSGIKI